MTVDNKVFFTLGPYTPETLQWYRNGAFQPKENITEVNPGTGEAFIPVAPLTGDVIVLYYLDTSTGVQSIAVTVLPVSVGVAVTVLPVVVAPIPVTVVPAAVQAVSVTVLPVANPVNVTVLPVVVPTISVTVAPV